MLLYLFSQELPEPIFHVFKSTLCFVLVLSLILPSNLFQAQFVKEMQAPSSISQNVKMWKCANNNHASKEKFRKLRS